MIGTAFRPRLQCRKYGTSSALNRCTERSDRAKDIETLFFNSAGRFPTDAADIDPLVGRNHLFVIPQPDSPLLELLGARYYLQPDADGVPRIMENPRAMPRYWMVFHSLTEADGPRALALVQTGKIDPRNTAILAAPLNLPPSQSPSSEVRIDRYDEDQVDLSTHASADGLLCTSEVYDEGWHARLDGREVPVLRCFHTFLAVPIAAGNHRVALRYNSPVLTLGLVLCGAGAFVLVLYIRG